MSPPEARLLLVDDDVSALQIMSRLLAHYPNQRFATNGEDALRLARESVPDLILLDADMPGLSGLDVCETLKADPLLADVPVIFATSHPAPLLEAAALGRGAADFVTKPLVAEQLTTRVRARLQQARLTERAHTGPLDAARAARLLIVDADVAEIRTLRSTLASLGELHFASSGLEALALARRLAPELIVIDSHMPDMDGFTVCQTLKAEAAFEHVPIVLVTGFSDPRHERRAFDLGAADFVSKPYAPPVLQARVRNLLMLKRRTDAQVKAAHDHWRGVSDARVADIVGAASDAIVSHDAGGRVVLANTAACRLFDMPLAQLLGQPVQALLGDDFAARSALSSSTPTPVAKVPRGGGAPLALEAAVSAVGEGPQRLTTVMLRDVSVRERLAAESLARAEAEAASRAKAVMLSAIAHELGNPLSALLGFTQLMMADTAQPLPPDQARRLEQVMAGARHLQRLMRDVTDLGGLESGRLAVDLQVLELAPCIEAAASATAALAQQAGITIDHRPAPTLLRVRADPGRLHQCLLNLLSNAIKYNRRAGWVRIETHAGPGHVDIAVHDNGLGMDEAQRARLFEPFNRLGRAVVPGAGLGLMVTRQLALAMHGSLRVESAPLQGSCFTLTLPLAPPGPAGDAAPAPSPQGVSN